MLKRETTTKKDQLVSGVTACAAFTVLVSVSACTPTALSPMPPTPAPAIHLATSTPTNPDFLFPTSQATVTQVSELPTTTISSTTVFTSPSGVYLAIETTEGMVCGTAGSTTHIVETTTMNTVLHLPGVAFSMWLTDQTAEIVTAGCDRADAYILDVETGERTGLGGLGYRYWTPDGDAFAEYPEEMSSGIYGSFWVYDLEQQIQVRSQDEQKRYDTLCWTPSGLHLIYTSQVLTHSGTFTITVGPRQVWAIDRQNGEERMLLGDSKYDYLITSGNPRQWTCNWRGDWIQVHKAPYVATSAPIEPWSEDWESLRCPIYGRGCEIEEILGLDWHTGEIMSWDEVPVSE